MRDDTGFSARVLNWYDQNARDLPWRVPPSERKAGRKPDPYRVWLSEIMLQQTTVAAVRAYFARFIARWPDVGSLSAADSADVMSAWAGLGYYARARNLLACARAVSAAGGVFPDDENDLRELPGIGAYTAASIAAIAFDRKAVVVDGNIERVMARFFAVSEPLPGAKPVLRANAARLTPAQRPGDYAQALMDLGATVCTPRNPVCSLCPVRSGCAGLRLGLTGRLPARLAKAAKPARHGRIWVAVRDDGAILTVRRPQKGLLGGMLALPSGGWDGEPDAGPPFAADWRVVGEVRHTFTHFHLIMVVLRAVAPKGAPGTYIPGGQLDPGVFPTLMRKALAFVRDAAGA